MEIKKIPINMKTCEVVTESLAKNRVCGRKAKYVINDIQMCGSHANMVVLRNALDDQSVEEVNNG